MGNTCLEIVPDFRYIRCGVRVQVSNIEVNSEISYEELFSRHACESCQKYQNSENPSHKVRLPCAALSKTSFNQKLEFIIFIYTSASLVVLLLVIMRSSDSSSLKIKYFVTLLSGTEI